MDEKNDGGPAFPMAANEYAGHGPAWGMSLRDYFAAKALAALIECAPDEACSASDDETVERERNEFAYDVARDAYRYADAMLRARGAC